MEPNKCNCEDISCLEGCTKPHTHKGFWCEKCHPERYKDTTTQPEELKKEWEKSFDEMFGQFQYPGITSPSWNEIDMKRFISSLLAKQQEEFVKIVTELEAKDEDIEPRGGFCVEFADGYNNALADIKSKLKI